MGNDLFGGLGNLGALGDIVSGIAKSGLAPQDDPGVKMINAQSELNELKKKEQEILIQIGNAAFSQNPSAWPQAEELNYLRSNIQNAEGKLQVLKNEQDEIQKQKEAEDAIGRCPSCGHRNPEGINFCQECGTKLGASTCIKCGATLEPGIRFCGQCGSSQEG